MAWAALSSWPASTEETICASLTVKPSLWVASRGKPAAAASAFDAEERKHRGRVFGVGQAAHARRQQRVVGRHAPAPRRRRPRRHHPRARRPARSSCRRNRRDRRWRKSARARCGVEARTSWRPGQGTRFVSYMQDEGRFDHATSLRGCTKRQLRSAADAGTEPHRRCAARACCAVGLLVPFHRGHRHRHLRLPGRDDLLRHLGLHRALFDDAGRIHDRRVADIHAQAAGSPGTAVPRIDRSHSRARGFRYVSRVPARVDRSADRRPSRLCKRVPRPPMAQRDLTGHWPSSFSSTS